MRLREIVKEALVVLLGMAMFGGVFAYFVIAATAERETVPVIRDTQCRQLCEWMGDVYIGQNDIGCVCRQDPPTGPPADAASGTYHIYDWSGEGSVRLHNP